MSNGEIERNQSILIKNPSTPRIGLIINKIYILSIYKNTLACLSLLEHFNVKQKDKREREIKKKQEKDILLSCV